jgi:hypothetical protein
MKMEQRGERGADIRLRVSFFEFLSGFVILHNGSDFCYERYLDVMFSFIFVCAFLLYTL